MPSYCEKFLSNPASDNETCAVSAFATNVTIKCNEWVFSDERTIVNDVSNIRAVVKYVLNVLLQIVNIQSVYKRL